MLSSHWQAACPCSLIREFTENPLESERAQAAVQRMNSIHSKYRISNQDYVYVLCLFMLEPTRWIDQFGYRTSHDHEKMVPPIGPCSDRLSFALLLCEHMQSIPCIQRLSLSFISLCIDMEPNAVCSPK